MNARKPPELPAKTPTVIMEAFRRRFRGRELLALETVFALRSAAQQLDNAITELMAGAAGSPARYQVLGLLWAAKGRGVPHKDIVAAMEVTRATVSGLMAALERDGLVSSAVDPDDRRQLRASLTARGQAFMGKSVETNAARLSALFGSLSAAELASLTALLQRIREGFAAAGGARRKQ